MRELLVRRLGELIAQHPVRVDRIAVVGGSKDEPELSLFPGAQVSVFGIEDTDSFLDLNSKLDGKPLEYDLVICNQVLEHVWNHHNFFGNLATMTAPNGLLWVSAPTSNFPHASPDYFAAGFTASYLERNLQNAGLVAIACGEVSSRRNYLMRHIFGVWLTSEESQKPARAAWSRLLKADIKSWRRAVLLLLSIPLINPSGLHGGRFSVESYYFGLKVKGN